VRILIDSFNVWQYNNYMSIATRKGDKGFTSLCGGGRVLKNHPRIEACGTIDELCAFLGFAKSMIKQEKTKNLLTAIQQDLYVIATELSAKSVFARKLKKRIIQADVDGLEKIIAALEAKIALTRGCFYVAGENMLSAGLDVARTVARRAERVAVGLVKNNMVSSPFIIPYLNKLSDLLFLLTRAFERSHKVV
jgi:cob(I)alamin adenosyltransferase